MYSSRQCGRPLVRNSLPQNRKPVIMKNSDTPTGPNKA